jgi:hypothetical protein
MYEENPMLRRSEERADSHPDLDPREAGRGVASGRRRQRAALRLALGRGFDGAGLLHAGLVGLCDGVDHAGKSADGDGGDVAEVGGVTKEEKTRSGDGESAECGSAM